MRPELRTLSPMLWPFRRPWAWIAAIGLVAVVVLVLPLAWPSRNNNVANPAEHSGQGLSSTQPGASGAPHQPKGRDITHPLPVSLPIASLESVAALKARSADGGDGSSRLDSSPEPIRSLAPVPSASDDLRRKVNVPTATVSSTTRYGREDRIMRREAGFKSVSSSFGSGRLEPGKVLP